MQIGVSDVFLGVWVVVVWNEVERAFDILVPFDIETKLILR